jgi:cyanate permease
VSIAAMPFVTYSSSSFAMLERFTLPAEIFCTFSILTDEIGAKFATLEDSILSLLVIIEAKISRVAFYLAALYPQIFLFP